MHVKQNYTISSNNTTYIVDNSSEDLNKHIICIYSSNIILKDLILNIICIFQRGPE